MASFTAPGRPNGITLTCATSPMSGITWLMEDFTLPECSVKSIPTSTMATTAATFLPSKLQDNGMLKISVQCDADLDPQTIVGKVGSFTVTFPLEPSTASTNATAAFSGFYTKYSPKSVGLEDIFKADVELQISGAVTYTAQT